MPGSAKKQHTRKKYGKKRKKSQVSNFKKRSAPVETVEITRDPERNADADGAADAPDSEIGLAAPTGPPGPSQRVRLDTAMLQPSEVREKKAKAEERLHDLASKPAMKRKMDCFASESPDVATGPVDTNFLIASLDSLNSLMNGVKCKTCGGNVSVSTGEREYGLAVKLCLECVNCGVVSSSWSSPRVEGEQKVNPFVVNVLAARAMQSSGNRQAALNDVFAEMNISHRGLHTKTWQHYVKTKLTPAATRAADSVTTESAKAVRELYRELDIDNPGNIAVSYDGSWMTRGHTSHIGVGTVIELFTGLVLDYVVLSNFCAGCERAPDKNDPAYQSWTESHVCQKNTDKKAGEMEVQAALILFERSLAKYGLRYTTILCDGDCRTYLALSEAGVYGYIKIVKEDCINHVEKRMGTNLRTLKSKSGGAEGLGGKGRLTGELITKLSRYYGWALKSHKGNVEETQKAVMATYHHVTSNDAVSDHSLCPTGPDSWCRQNAAIAKGEPTPKHRYNLPPHVCKVLRPVYERLSDRKLLERCQRGQTQNNNESLHAVIWALAPKERHASLFTVEAAVAEAVMRFNGGNERTSAGILKELNLTPGQKSARRTAEKDRRRAAESARKRAAAENVQRAVKKRHTNAGKQTDYIPGGY